MGRTVCGKENTLVCGKKIFPSIDGARKGVEDFLAVFRQSL